MDISSKSGMKLDPERPFESLAKKMLSHFLAGRIDNRINLKLCTTKVGWFLGTD